MKKYGAFSLTEKENKVEFVSIIRAIYMMSALVTKIPGGVMIFESAALVYLLVSFRKCIRDERIAKLKYKSDSEKSSRNSKQKRHKKNRIR